MKLKEILDRIIKEYNLKEGDYDTARAIYAEEKSLEVENGGDSKGQKAKEAEVAVDLADKIAEKFANIYAQKNGLTPNDKKSLENQVKTKIFTSYGGVKELEFASDLTKLSKGEKIVEFFKALMYHKVSDQADNVLKALVEGTDSEGGYLVPEELRSEVFRILPDIAVMRRIARVIPMSTDTLKLNSLTARPVAYWTSEYASSSTSSAEFGEVTLSPNTLVALLPMSEQLMADANINMVQFITELFAEAIGTAEDAAFFTGSGTGQPKGIYTETLGSVAAGANLFDSIIDLMGALPQRVRNGRRFAFVGNEYTNRQFAKVKDNDGAYIWRQGGSSQNSNGETVALPDVLYGRPLYEQNDLPNGVLLAGDFSYYIIGDRQVMSVRTTTEGGEAWRRNAMEVKAVERVDGKAVITSPFKKLTGI